MPSHTAVQKIDHRSNLFLKGSRHCVPADPADTVTARLNTLLASSGPGYTLRLCPNTRYYTQAPIEFAHHGQEISTLGYPIDDSRATIVVTGNITSHAVAVKGRCKDCSGIKLLNIQVEGNRYGQPRIMHGGANIEMGGSNSDQIIDHVKSYNPRGWSCLHISEGDFACKNVTVQNSEIGPCGIFKDNEWADGISLSCENSVVRDNVIKGATDGGIVVFGAPGSWIYNNSIYVGNETLLGGINMVDIAPYRGSYRGTVVQNNTIVGAFANQGNETLQEKGVNQDNAVIKIGIAVGPRCWRGDRLGTNRSESGTVIGNRLTGAFSYGIAVGSAFNFTVQDNTLFGNTSFIGVRGPKCTDFNKTPSPAPFIIDYNITSHCNVQPEFQTVSDGDSLICVVPEKGAYQWPFQTDERPVAESRVNEETTRHAIAALAGAVFVIFGYWSLKRRVSRYLAARSSRLYYSLKIADDSKLEAERY